MQKIMWGRPIELGDKRVLKPGRWLWLRAIAWLVFSLFVIAVLFGEFSDFLGKSVPHGSPGLAFAARCSGPLIALLAYVALVRLGEARWPSELGLRPLAQQLLTGLLIGAVMFATVMLILTSTGLYDLAYIGWKPAWKAAGSAIEAGVVEELMVRGLMLRLMWRSFGPAVAFIISAAAFGAGHLGNDNVSAFAVICIALEAGIMLGAFYALTGRLWVSIGVHAAWNFSQGYVFGAAVSGESLGASLAESHPRDGFAQWLTGGPFGPEASLAALLVCSAVGALTMVLAWKAGRFELEPPHMHQPLPRSA